MSGYWTDVQVSHQAHYFAGPWAANNQTMGAGQRLLGIVNTKEPDRSNVHIKNPPGGADEQVDKIQWISDNDMIVRNRSGRKFLWNVGANTYEELLTTPASFNGYTLTEEFYAPDGLRYGGLMSKDGGATTEVWTSKPDYSDMQQITHAGMKFVDFQWLGSSKYVSAWASGLPIPNDGNTCKTVIVDASSARQLSASQIESARIPTYLPCGFRATK